uniref:Coilin N-terminal domain-containing protein n=1 Tax=Cercocebus atys TaxID=9531 RepID=A0A2K5MMA3_CERAT
MAASEPVRLGLQYPPAATLCRVITDLISLICQRFGVGSGRGLVPPTESARLVRDNDCLRVKLEDRGVAENSVVISNGDSIHLSLRKAKKRTFKLEEDEETEPDYKYSKKHWKRQENNNNNEKVLNLERKAVTDQTITTCGTAGDDNKETKRKSPKKRRNVNMKKRPGISTLLKYRCSSPKGSARNSLVKTKRKGDISVCSNGSPSSSSESESCHESISDGPSKVSLEARNSSEKLPTDTTAEKLATKPGLSLTPSKGKTSGTSSSSSDSGSESDDQCLMSSSTPECATVGLFAGRGCPGPGLSSQTAGAPSGLNGGRQALGPSPNVSVPSLGRGWGRGEDLFSWKAARGRGMWGRGHPVSCVVNRSTGNQTQQQLNEVVTNSSAVFQNPVETHQKDCSLLLLLAAAPQIGEKVIQQVNREILSSLPTLREPGKFDLVYHNENGTVVVEYALMQESKVTVFWGELIDPRLIIESLRNVSSCQAPG